MISFCFLIFALSGLTLLYYFYHNKNRKIERYYYKKQLLLFALLEFTQFILIVSVVMNARYIINKLFQFFKKYFKTL